jgi:predicted acylesterase/phospholipase RssA
MGLAGCVLLGDKADQFRWHFGTLPFYVFDNAPGYKRPPQPNVLNKPVNVVIAISGGGTRSAVFAAGAMEQLAYLPRPDSQSVLERAQVVSGVSAGSLAAAYYALYKPPRFHDPAEKEAFFRQFKSHMSVDFWMRGWAHYLSHPWEGVLKYYTRYRFAQTLANTFDEHLFLGQTFADLSRREAAGEAPVTLINGTVLDTGERFVFTNLEVGKHFTVDPTRFQGDPFLHILATAFTAPTFRAVGFDSINSDILDFRVASAVAASSAFPVLPGPLTIRNYATGGYVHIADGGVSDNTGIDSLVQLFLAKAQRENSRLVIIALDASAPLVPKRLKDPNGYVGSAKYAENANFIQGSRSQTLAFLMYNATPRIRVVRLPLWESAFAQTLDPVPQLYISESDWHRVLCAAEDVVKSHRSEIIQAVFGE